MGVLRRYAKAIATATGTVVATVAGIYLGWGAEQIATQTTVIVGAVNMLVTTAFTIFSPANTS